MEQEGETDTGDGTSPPLPQEKHCGDHSFSQQRKGAPGIVETLHPQADSCRPARAGFPGILRQCHGAQVGCEFNV